MKVVDLFAGFGGASEGAKMAGCDVVAAYEISSAAARWHHENHPASRMVVTDVTATDWRFEASVVGPVDILMASPPCQGHSAAGRPARASGAADRHRALNNTAFAVVEAVAAFKPRSFLLENVPGWARWDRWDEFVRSLEGLGYGVATTFHDCADYGAGTRRLRMAVVGVRRGCGNAADIVAAMEAAKTSGGIPFRDLIRDEEGRWSPIEDDKRAKPLARRTRMVVDRGLAEFPGDYFLLPYYSEGSGLNPRSVDMPIPTLTRRARWALVHPEKGIRMLSARESMRAMSFPEDYKIPLWRGAPNTKRTLELAGNAVPPIAQAALLRCVMAGIGNR
jgi:DNA (cytosine-5)-methyltransferase 1